MNFTKLRIFWLLVAGLLSSAVGFAAEVDYAAIRSKLDLVRLEFLSLSGEMPYNSVLYGREEDVRGAYRLANSMLADAISQVSAETAEKARQTLISTYHQYRVVGLLMPFFAIDKKNRDGIIERFMKAQDLLGSATRQLGSPPPVEGPSQPWTNQGLIWKWIGKRSLTQGRADCSNTPMEGAVEKGRVPEFQELAGSWKDMKEVVSNRAFGEKAREFAEVWTNERASDPQQYTYIHFKDSKTGSAKESESYEVVCVAKARR